MGGAGPLGICTENCQVWLCLGVLLLRVGSLKERFVEVAVTPDRVCQDLIGGITAAFFPGWRCCE